MKLLGIVNVLGRLLLPRVTVPPASPIAGEVWEIGDQLFLRNAANVATRRMITDIDVGVANGVAGLGPDGLVPNAQLPTALSSAFSLPIGAGFDHYGDPSTIPSGCLVCDGAEYLRTEYPALFAAVRTRFGHPSTDLYFRVPDRIGKVGLVAWAYPNSGLVRRVDVVTRGQGYTPGSYTFTFTGGTFGSAATGTVVVVSENVPSVGVTGVIDHIDITLPGSYTTLGAAAPGTAANCALTIPAGSLPGGTGFTYDVFAQPVAGTRAPYAWAVRMTNHGTSYTTPPAVTFTGGSLKGATAYAVIGSGGVTEVVVTNPGIGSTSGVTVVFTGGGGSAAAASIAVGIAYGLPGDYVGDEAHRILLAELAAHHHTQGFAAGGAIGAGGTGAEVNTGDTGNDFPVPMHPASVAAIPVIRAV